jgi:hypothetical protein
VVPSGSVMLADTDWFGACVRFIAVFMVFYFMSFFAL